MSVLDFSYLALALGSERLFILRTGLREGPLEVLDNAGGLTRRTHAIVSGKETIDHRTFVMIAETPKRIL